MILVTGASGTVGSHVLRLLASGGTPVRAMTRDPARVPDSLPGVEVVQADFDDPTSLVRALAGVDAVFLLTAPPTPTPRHDLSMLETARAAGVTRVVKLSAIGTGELDGDGGTVGVHHLEAELAVRASGIAWTVLRPSTFASNALWWADAISSGDPISNMTGTGTQGVVDSRDVAAVAVEALVSPAHSGRTYTLTGPDLLSVPGQAELLGRVLGLSVRTVDLALDAARAQMLASGMDSVMVDVIVTGSAWVRAGHNAIITDDVADVLGRPPTSFEAWSRDHRAVFAGR
jgi:uncharacterized protein YbjT (DUF2867 family)